ncbi:hypothetical protein [Schnuerera sp.]|uniref:hypothetical protein n=1 Tax=Schnuerera sp. TaxID=2794844 RepID=UPI002C9ABC14|nr:hypothetical protein [Schnuerera sp.]HSH35416.1 hypothetical protein [Schnuerera sp.]
MIKIDIIRENFIVMEINRKKIICYNKAQARKIKTELKSVIKKLDNFIKKSDY